MAVVLQAVSVIQLSYSLTTDSAPASRHPRPAATSSGRSSLVSISCVGGETHGSPTATHGWLCHLYHIPLLAVYTSSSHRAVYGQWAVCRHWSTGNFQ